MLKSLLLSSTRYFAPDDEKGTAKSSPEDGRKKVTMTGTTTGDEKEEGEKEEKDDKDTVDKDDGEKEEDKEEAEEEIEGEEKDEKEDGEKKELTAEQKEIVALKKQVDRLQKRVGRTSGERDDIKKELKDAKAALEAKVEEGTQPLTEEEVERRSTEKANQTVTQREFDATQKKLIKEATAIDKEFLDKVNDMAKEIAPLPGFMIGLLGDLDNGGAVLNHLTDNIDDYEEIYQLSPARMAVRLAKISDKLIEDAKPKKKKISEVPEPPGKLKGSNTNPDKLDPKNMSEFVRIRNKQVEDRRKRKLGLAT